MPAIAALVRDLGLDGMDIDYEPRNPFCAGVGGRVSCATDARWETIVRESRAALPRPLLLTASVWSVGAYGEGDFAASRPQSRYTGFSLAILRSKLAGALDLLLINGYDAGPGFDPLEAFRAYRAVWPGRLALGVAVRRKGGTGPFPTVAKAEALAREVARDPWGGMMLYPLLAMPEGGGPSASDLAGALCRGLGIADCAAPIP
jgi:chitinase